MNNIELTKLDLTSNNREVDAYLKKTIKYDYRGHSLNFQVSQSLFSSHEVDHGTQRLLRTFTFEKIDAYNKVLDFGGGYGPIGIALKSFYPDSVVHMVDRDALALDYSRRNAVINNVGDIKTYASLGYDDIVGTNFDLIVSNIPAKVGEKALSHILKDSQFYLRQGGRVAVVVIDAIVEYIASVLTADPNINILFRKAWPGHTVFHYNFTSDNRLITKPQESAFDRGIFYREDKVFSVGTLSFPMKTTYGLSEFNTLNYEAELLIDNLQTIQNRPINTGLIFNPGQGHIPVALSLRGKTDKIVLADRDLQAIRVSRRNLLLNGYSAKNILLLHQIGLFHIEGPVDCIIGILDDKDGPAIHEMLLEQAASILSPKGIIMISSSSTPITRIEKSVKAKKYLDILERRKFKGKSIMTLKHKNY